MIIIASEHCGQMKEIWIHLWPIVFHPASIRGHSSFLETASE